MSRDTTRLPPIVIDWPPGGGSAAAAVTVPCATAPSAALLRRPLGCTSSAIRCSSNRSATDTSCRRMATKRTKTEASLSTTDGDAKEEGKSSAQEHARKSRSAANTETVDIAFTAESSVKRSAQHSAVYVAAACSAPGIEGSSEASEAGGPQSEATTKSWLKDVRKATAKTLWCLYLSNTSWPSRQRPVTEKAPAAAATAPPCPHCTAMTAASTATMSARVGLSSCRRSVSDDIVMATARAAAGSAGAVAAVSEGTDMRDKNQYLNMSSKITVRSTRRDKVSFFGDLALVPSIPSKAAASPNKIVCATTTQISSCSPPGEWPSNNGELLRKRK
mmetsp:Transcript_73984/g.199424  ORF Transcript_73984/g.199424 Transcript_73984/m.199424 type:complete len:333 (-) Transcript_73984:393-1391(-)